MTIPRIPLHLQNPDLAKSLASSIEKTSDYKKPETVPSQRLIEPQYRAPHDRVNGNELFRRFPDGRLDFEAAKHIILDALHKVKHLGPGMLTSGEQAAFCCLFPKAFDYVDSGVVDAVRKVTCKLSKDEVKQLAMLVALHLNEELNYNAGMGGGSVIPRSDSQS